MVHFVLVLAVALTIIGYKNKYVQFLAFMVLLIFATLRYMYGNDYYNYYMWFEYIKLGGESPFTSEILYTWMNQHLPNFFVLIGIESVLLIFSTYSLIKKNVPTEYVWISMIIFVFNPYIFLMNLSAVRQSFAMSLFVVAAGFAYRKKYLRYIILVAVAALIHKSAWLLMPFCFIINDRPVRPLTCWIILGSVLSVMALDVLGDVVAWGAGLFEDKNYMHMAEQDVQNSVRATLLTSLYFVYTLFNLPKLKGRTLAFAKLYLLSPLLGVLAREVAMLTRLQMYFDIFSVVVLPMIFVNVQSRGPVILNRRNPLITFWDCVNKYALPALILMVYALRYYSFSTNPMWASFLRYYTLFLRL